MTGVQSVLFRSARHSTNLARHKFVATLCVGDEGDNNEVKENDHSESETRPETARARDSAPCGPADGRQDHTTARDDDVSAATAGCRRLQQAPYPGYRSDVVAGAHSSAKLFLC